jgi:magnesium chelatase subunit D
MLEVVEGRTVKFVMLNTSHSDDDLWVNISLEVIDDKTQCKLAPGLLTHGFDDTAIKIVIIPDLANLSLAVRRACIMLISADVVHLERHGQSLAWAPDMCWIAACSSEDNEIGQVSPHLLDRFALRLPKSGSMEIDRKAILHQMLQSMKVTSTDKTINTSAAARKKLSPLAEYFQTAQLTDSIVSQLQRVFHLEPEINDSILETITGYFESDDQSSLRRELALVHLSLAMAQLVEQEKVTQEHVQKAMKIIGLKKHSSSAQDESMLKETPSRDELEQPLSDTSPKPEAPLPISPLRPESLEPAEENTVPVHAPTEHDRLEPLGVILQDDATESPYPEDNAPVMHESASLRMPMRQHRTLGTAKGLIVGTQRSTTLRDLALVPTLLEAAKYQKIRHPIYDGTIKINPMDIRSYRRLYTAEHMLVLLVDYTSIQKCAWQEALLPYLRWAYQVRANIQLIRVGARSNTRSELQAEVVSARSVLVPKIIAALEDTAAGRATPLAHGLDIALQGLRRTLQHGRHAIRQATMVIVTDGRGNIPLKASYENNVAEPIGDEGVSDARKVAEELSKLQRLQIIVLDPQPEYYSELPQDLATALSAPVQVISLLDLPVE